MITSTIHALILMPVFFVMMEERALRKGRKDTYAHGINVLEAALHLYRRDICQTA